MVIQAAYLSEDLFPTFHTKLLEPSLGSILSKQIISVVNNLLDLLDEVLLYSGEVDPEGLLVVCIFQRRLDGKDRFLKALQIRSIAGEGEQVLHLGTLQCGKERLNSRECQSSGLHGLP
uniref:Uncharacterized protein n=1 Tax=Opuntia streptacantha TaxID=393608 RepID=A0A7C8YS09_OPUST